MSVNIKETDEKAPREASVVIRQLQGTQGLEGAFRVHILPESLEQAGLKVGDSCCIVGEDGSTGRGVAWRADDRMGSRPKDRPAKTTEILRSAFGFEIGSRVTITKTDEKVYAADRIIVSDVTAESYNKPGDVDDGLWRIRVEFLFASCEALARGVSFDVTDKKKFRKRFRIDHIESAAAATDKPCLFHLAGHTNVSISPPAAQAQGKSLRGSAGASASTVAPNGTTNHEWPGINANGDINSDGASVLQLSLNSERIGGLTKQIEQLNLRLRRLVHTASTLNKNSQGLNNPPIVVHGYEGCGKTMLLDTLAYAGFRRVLRLDKSSLLGATVTARQAFIQATFTDAADNQPSLILMDNLDSLVPTDDIAYAETLGRELAAARHKQIMVVAASRTPSNIHPSLFGPGRFLHLIELPIPDTAAREQILNVLRGLAVSCKDSSSSQLAAQMHGFTCKDVAWLYELAEVHAGDRYMRECDELAMLNSSSPPAHEHVVGIAQGFNLAGVPNPTITMADFQAVRHKVTPTALREIFTEKPKTRWTDIGGSTSVKASFDKIIEWPMKNSAILAENDFKPPKGILLYGPPGCSKTLTAQAVANNYNFNFIAIKGAELLSMYVGESERAVREVFRKARAAAPCVIFFDEIDAIGSNRDSTGTSGLNVLTTLLNEMDGFESLGGVLILAATNRPESLDSALMRPGRFDKHVYLGPPTEAARREILAISTKSASQSHDVDPEALVAKTEGYSGAEIVRISNVVKEKALERYFSGHVSEVIVEMADFDAAFEEVRRGITKEMLEAYREFEARDRGV